LAKQQQHKTRQREEEAFQDNCSLDHEIAYALRARVTERQQKDAANDRKRITTAQRENAGWQLWIDRCRGPSSKGKQAWVDIENRVDGYFPAVSRHMAQQGIEVLGWDDWAQADVIAMLSLGSASRANDIVMTQ
jgi:hypothetical protein